MALTALFAARRGLRTTHVLAAPGLAALLPLRSVLEMPVSVLVAVLATGGALLTPRELWRARS